MGRRLGRWRHRHPRAVTTEPRIGGTACGECGTWCRADATAGVASTAADAAISAAAKAGFTYWVLETPASPPAGGKEIGPRTLVHRGQIVDLAPAHAAKAMLDHGAEPVKPGTDMFDRRIGGHGALLLSPPI